MVARKHLGLRILDILEPLLDGPQLVAWRQVLVRVVVVVDGYVLPTHLRPDRLIEREQLCVVLAAAVLDDLVGLFVADDDQDVQGAQLGYFYGFPKKRSLPLAFDVDTLSLVLDGLLLVCEGRFLVS